MEKHQKLSVFISLILRHKPEVIGLTLDDEGYLEVNKLIEKINESGREIDLKILNEIVVTDNKKRYSFNEDKTKIRANQGHSIPVNLSLKKAVPKGPLYHGSSEKSKELIAQLGLIKGSRNYVHLSENLETAIQVGSRRGKPIVYQIDYNKMLEDNFELWISENNVWLSNDIPPKYLTLLNL